MDVGLSLKKDISLLWGLKTHVAPHLGPEVGDFTTPSMQAPFSSVSYQKRMCFLCRKKEIGVASCASFKWSASTPGSMPWPIASKWLLAWFSISCVLNFIGNRLDTDALKWW